MRSYLLCLSYCLLSSCAYYGDIHGHSCLENPANLSTHHIFKKPANKISSQYNYKHNWWEKFRDPQLNQLIAVALCDSPNMQIAEARVRQAQALAYEASSLLWPSIEFSGYLQRQKFSQTGLVPPPFNGKTFNIGVAGLNFNYEFDFWGKNRQTLMAKINEACAAKAELAEARLVISAAVANTYFQLLNNIEQASIAKTNWQISKRLASISQHRLGHGINSDIPVKRIEVNTQSAKVILEQYRQAELLSRHQLAVLLGKNPFTTKIETQQFQFHPWHVELPACLPARLLANRPDIHATKFRAIAAANRINVAKYFFRISI